LEYNQSKLYGLKSKKLLSYYLCFPSKDYFKQDFVAKQIHPCLDYQNGKARLLEKPKYELGQIQKRLKTLLAELDTPDYVFSGVKGRSYVDNAKMWHYGNRYLYKIDLTAFFPSITRESVYSFYKTTLNTSSDIAELLTNLTTVDLDLTVTQPEEMSQINSFLNSKSVNTRNHLISGSSPSQLLSYHVNSEMFDKLNCISKESSMSMTIYVDDIIFSSSRFISNKIIRRINSVIKSYGYMLSIKKVKLHSKNYPKRVTGVIINSHGEVSIPNALQFKIYLEFYYLRNHPDDKKVAERLYGRIVSARQIIPDAFPSIYQYARKYL